MPYIVPIKPFHANSYLTSPKYCESRQILLTITGMVYFRIAKQYGRRADMDCTYYVSMTLIQTNLPRGQMISGWVEHVCCGSKRRVGKRYWVQFKSFHISNRFTLLHLLYRWHKQHYRTCMKDDRHFIDYCSFLCMCVRTRVLLCVAYVYYVHNI
jgi:hypothetical protein